MKKTLIINGESVEIDQLVNRNSEVSFIYNDVHYTYNLNNTSSSQTVLGGTSSGVVTHCDQYFVANGQAITIELPKRSRDKSNSEHSGSMISPMPGKILKVLVKSGDKVSKGDSLVVMEAMKMEHTIKASDDGKIISVHFEEGSLVDGGVELVDLEVEE